MIDRPTIEDIAYRSRWGQTDGRLTFTDFRHPGVLHVMHEHLTNGSLRERLGVPDSLAGSVSRIIAEAVSQRLIKPLDENAGNRYMKYTPYWA